MFSLQKPTESDVIEYLVAQRDQPFSYAQVGASRDNPPNGFCVDHHRVLLGRGEETFDRARTAIQQWQMFPKEMLELFWPDSPIEVGTNVAVLFRAPLFWSLNPCRIVYVIDDDAEGECVRFGFAYGTLPDHLECGEERFSVEWNRSTDEVFYDLFVFSRPQHVISRIGYPYARWQQARFRQLSGSAIQSAVQTSEFASQCTT